MNAIGRDNKTRPPSWAEFLRIAAKRLGSPNKKIVREVNNLIDSKDYLTAAEVIRNGVGKEKFTNILKECFHAPDFQPAKIHDLLFQLDLRISITPNVDCIFETSVGRRGAGAVTVKKYDDGDVADALRRHERVLIKSHGSISHPFQIIFTRTDYAQARNKHADFYELIEALLRTHTFLFIGCGLDDPDIRALLENYRYRHPAGQSHYFVVPLNNLSQEVRSVLEESMKINIIQYPKSSDHSHLTYCLEHLVQSVESERVEIAKSQTW
ncbi:SIR2 family protein [Methylocaldum sp. MU1018]